MAVREMPPEPLGYDLDEMEPSRISEEDSKWFDETLGYDDETGIRFAKGLSPSDRKLATALYRVFNGLWGLCVIKGLPGAGKDLFGNWLQYKLKKFFPQKRFVRDEKPRRLFGRYDGFFDDEAIVSSLRKMSAIAKGKQLDDDDEETTSVPPSGRMDAIADDWVKGAGGVLLKNSVSYLTEFWRYCDKMQPHNPLNRTMGAIHKVKRHLDILIIGTTQTIDDLDRFRCKPYIDWQVTCTRSSKNRTGFSYFIHKVRYDKRRDELNVIGSPLPLHVDAGKPRSDMGDGKIVVLRPSYLPVNEEEEVVLRVLNAGCDKYEDLVDFIRDNGDMSEWEVLETLKRLSFAPSKRVITYPCPFRIYNSKSAIQVKTSLRVEG